MQPQQRVLFCEFSLPEVLLFGHAEGLFQAERHSGRIVVRISVQSHAATLGKGRFFQCNGKRQQGLVALHRHTVGVGMKQGGIALPLRCRAVGQGKQYPYLGTPSAGTAESGKGLWQQGGLLLYIFRFGNARQTVYFQLYESVIVLHPPFPLLCTAIFHGGIDAGQLVYMFVLGASALQLRKDGPEGRYMSGFGFGF